MKKIFLFAFLVFLAVGLVVPSFAQSAPDPVRLAVGARPLGMGKAFVGLADDVGSIYLNPAGLANPERWQVTSMSGKFLDEFNYLTLSGLYPTQYGTFGLAYVGSSIGGAYPTTIEAGSDPADPIYTIDLSQDAMNYYNNLLILSYGAKLGKVLDLPFLSSIGKRFPGLRETNFGANIKLFSVNLTGDHITQGNATGKEIDLGLQGKVNPWCSLGLTLNNILPASMGGKLHYDSGWDESYPGIVKIGSSFDILGPENALRTLWTHKLKFLADFDCELDRAVPNLFHLGLEWQPMDLIAIRSGIDQDMSGASQTVNNFTGGVGLTYGDFRFDYAFHQFSGAPGVDNHFFSFSYGIAPGKKGPKILLSPDKLITLDPAVDIAGSAIDPQIVQVKISSIKTPLSPRGEFKTRVSLPVGKNAILVEGFDEDGKLVETAKSRILRLASYPDVTKEYWAREEISYIGTLGLVKGYPDGKFKPQGNITRAELATLLMRTQASGDANVPTSSIQRFKDVALKHWGLKYINAAATAGIVTGYPDKTFKPSANLTRAEGLAMIARFGGVPQQPYIKQFSDVNARHWAAGIIAGAQAEGMLSFLKGQPFEPNRKLTRAEAVKMLYGSKPVGLLVKGLQDFSKGY
jgi:hypothetical protein